MSIRITGRGGLAAPLFASLFLAAVLSCLAGLSSPAYGASPLSGFNPARLAGGGREAFVETSAFAGDTALPLAGINNDSWNGSFTPREPGHGEAYWNLAGGVVFDGFRVAAVNRGEWFLKANRDTQDFFYRIKKHLDLPVGKTYHIDLSINGFAASGVEISYGRSLGALLPGLSVGATVRYLRPATMQDGSVKGTVTPTGPKSYDFNLNVNYQYDRNILYRRRNTTVGDGVGYSADLGVAFQRDAFRCGVLARDLAGEIIWYAVPYTDAVASTDRLTTSPDGYQNFSPTISGYEGNKRFHQRIPLKIDFEAGYSAGDLDGLFTVNLVDDEPHYWLEGSYRLGSRSSVSLGYNVEYSAVKVGFAFHDFSVSVLCDDVRVAAAKAFGGELAYHYSW
ncbi:hypothetical protein GMSM_01880 [Geomonas sp. Red276]